MLKKNSSRRQFLSDTLKLVGASATVSLLPESILRAQSIAAASTTGTIQDVKHVVILMQENRSFDHYLGSAAGVRGFGDPRPVVLPTSGYPVWYQPSSFSYVLPFRPASSGTNGDTYYAGLNHDWGGGHSAWNLGRYDNWIPAKSAATMTYFTSQDIPYYYSLAQAFTVCDSYHCSQLGPTNPNRLYFFSGSCGNVAGASPQIDNDATRNANWTTLPERLNQAGISWKVYQDKGQGLDANSGFGEYKTGTASDLWWNGNYGDNTLLNFKQYQNLASTSTLTPAFNGTQIDARGSGQPYDTRLFQQLKDDVMNDTLPQVSWIAAPYAYTEHPSWASSGGEWYVSNILNALTSNPAVWASTVFFITYDENDGFFDHMPPPVPPTPGNGKSNVSTAAEFYNSSSPQSASDGTKQGDQQIGLGVRVPMFVLSPWSKGGKVNSEVFDHTSIIRFIEARFNSASSPLKETNITAWRRAVCGDLTSAFDFSAPPQAGSTTTIADSKMDPNGPTVPSPQPPSPQKLPTISASRRTACRLPYGFLAKGSADRTAKAVALTFTNTGRAGLNLQVRTGNNSGTAPRHYTLAPGNAQAQVLQDSLAVGADGSYDLSVYGPNGFLQEFRGNIGSSGTSGSLAEIQLGYDVQNGNVRITLDNSKSSRVGIFQLTDNAYKKNASASVNVAAGATQDVAWLGDAGWYDVAIRVADDVNYLRRVAGCVQLQSGSLLTDSAIGNTTQFVPSFSVQGTTSATLRFDYVAPPWQHSPKNWIGVFKRGVKPSSASWLAWVYAPKSVGSVMLASRSGNAALASGQYDLWYLFDDGYGVLSGPVALNL